MKAIIIAGIVIAVFNVLNSTASANDMREQLPRTFVSPNGILKAKIVFADDEYRLVIENVSSSEAGETKVIDGLPLAMKWAKDSRSLIIIEHLAGGSNAQVIFRDGTKWISFEADPGLKMPATYSVVGVDDSGDGIRFTYKVAYEKPNGEVTRFGKYSFTLDLKTRKRSGVVDSAIDYKQYKSLNLSLKTH